MDEGADDTAETEEESKNEDNKSDGNDDGNEPSEETVEASETETSNEEQTSETESSFVEETLVEETSNNSSSDISDSDDEVSEAQDESVEESENVEEVNAGDVNNRSAKSTDSPWDFSDSEFASADLKDGYKGLIFSSTNAAAHGNKYLKLNKDGYVQIPIDTTKDSTISVGYDYAANAKFEDEKTASIYINGTGGSGTALYYYVPGSKLKNSGYVTVTGLDNGSNPTYITSITVETFTRTDSWIFSDDDFTDTKYPNADTSNDKTTSYNYNGLKIMKGAGSNQSKYIYAKNNQIVSVPVRGDCTITVSTDYKQNYYFKDEGTEKTQTGSGADYPYTYKGDAGYVDIVAPGETYFTKITVEYPLLPAAYDSSLKKDVWSFDKDYIEANANNMLATINDGDKKQDRYNIIKNWYADGTEAGTSGVSFKTKTYLDMSGGLKYYSNGGNRLYVKAASDIPYFADNTTLSDADGDDGDDSNHKYNGFIYGSANSSDWYEIDADAGDVITVYATSWNAGGAPDIEFGLLAEAGKKTLNKAGTPQTISVSNDNKVYKLKFYAKDSGTYYIYSSNTKLCTARVTREHVDNVAVSGTLTMPDGASGLSLVFTDKKTGYKQTAEIGSDGTYNNVNLYNKHSYTVSVTSSSGSYAIENEELSLSLPSGDSLTYTFTSTITAQEQITTYTLEGKITGLDTSDIAKLTEDNFKLVFENTEEKYKPKVTITFPESGASDLTYEASLQDGIAYEIKAEGIDDYELDLSVMTGSLSDGKIKITANKDLDIAYKKKTTYAVTINPSGKVDNETITETMLIEAGAKITFTNTAYEDESYKYSFNIGDKIELREGVYSVRVTDSAYINKSKLSNLTVNGSADPVSYNIEYKYANDWTFKNDANWKKYYPIGNNKSDYNYNGLKLPAGSGDNGQGVYLTISEGSVFVPVRGKSKIHLTCSYGNNYHIVGDVNDDGSDRIVTGTGGTLNEHDYSYSGESGYVEIEIKGTTNFTQIQVTPEGNEDKSVITDDFTLDFYAIVNKDKPAEGDPVESDIEGLTISGFTYFPSTNNHGIRKGNNASMKLNLKQKASIYVTTCSANSEGATIEAKNGKVIPLLSVPSDKGETAPQYFIRAGEGEVTLTFPSVNYLHKIEMKYVDKEEYVTTVTDDGNGTASANIQVATEGTKVTLTAAPASGYRLKEWTVTDSEGGSVSVDPDESDAKKATFTMPAKDVTVQAVFEEAGTSHSIRVASDIQHGTVTLLKTTDTSERVVKLSEIATAKADDGYEFKKWVITQADGTNVAYTKEGSKDYKFTMPDSDITISAEFEEEVPKYMANGKLDFEGKDDLLDRIDNTEGLTCDEFGLNDGDKAHGATTQKENSTMVLNLKKKADITIVGCRFANDNGTTPLIKAESGGQELDVDRSSDTDPVYTLSTEAGKLTLTFLKHKMYVHSITVEYDTTDEEIENSDLVSGNGKIDVWDFGAEQLNAGEYNNKLTVDIINSWYASDVTAGSSENNIGDFETKDSNGKTELKFNSNNSTSPSHRLRTTNTALTRYDAKSLKYGDDVTYTGYLYSNSGSEPNVYLQLAVQEGDVITLAVSSNGGKSTINFESPTGKVEQKLFEKGSGNADIMTFNTAETGLYKIYSTDEKLCVARIERDRPKVVTVSGSVTPAEGIPAGYALTFENQTTGVKRKADVKNDNTYEAELQEGYKYTVGLLGADEFVVKEGREIDLTAKTGQNRTNNVVIEGVLLDEVTGSFIGIDTEDLAKLDITLENAQKIYKPKLTISNGKYSAKFEQGVTYTVKASNKKKEYVLDDYVLQTQTVNKDTADITFEKKPTYKVTVIPAGDTESFDDIAGAVYTFYYVDPDKKDFDKRTGYVYTFDDPDKIALRNGTYEVKVEKSGTYVQQLTPNFEVNGKADSITIYFINGVTVWDFGSSDFQDAPAADIKNGYMGLLFKNVGRDSKGYATITDTIQIPINTNEDTKVIVTYLYNANVKFENEAASIVTADGSTSTTHTAEYIYTAGSSLINDGYVTLTHIGGEVAKPDGTKVDIKTSYLTKIEITPYLKYEETITVGKNKTYKTINDALDAVSQMDRKAEDGSIKHVTIAIDPGDYEEMLVVTVPNITLKNASEKPSIALENKGVDIDKNAVRITSYYGHGYTYYSMGSDCKYDAELLEINKKNKYPSFENPGAGVTSGSYWNATVVVDADNFSAEGIIFENSFNQYVSKKAAEDVIVKQSEAKEGSATRVTMKAGDTTVQEKAYVERAAALCIRDGVDKSYFENCRIVGRQDTFVGRGERAAFYKCDILGNTDFLCGSMTAVFVKCNLLVNTTKNKDDVSYIAVPQKDPRGFLMYNCKVDYAIAGADNAVDADSNEQRSQAYLGRPWVGDSAPEPEALFYKTILGRADNGLSIISSEGWQPMSGNKSANMQEYGTMELVKGIDNSKWRAEWATLLDDVEGTVTLEDGTEVTDDNVINTFLHKADDDWKPFENKDTTIVEPKEDEKYDEPDKTFLVPLNANNLDVGTWEQDYTTGGFTIHAGAAAENKEVSVDAFDTNEADDTDNRVEVGNYKFSKRLKLGSNGTEEYRSISFDATNYISGTLKVIAKSASGKEDRELAVWKEGQKDAAIIKTIKCNALEEYEFDLPEGGKYYIAAVDKGVNIFRVAFFEGTVVEKDTVAAPMPNIPGGTKVRPNTEITLTSGTADAKIYYTLDGTTVPSAVNGTEYTAPIKITADTTIKAIAVRDGYNDSEVVTLTYTVSADAATVYPPTANIATGMAVESGTEIILTCVPADAAIYYTLDGTEPTETKGTLYERPIKITADTTIKAVAVKDGETSEVSTFVYTVNTGGNTPGTVSKPTANISSGTKVRPNTEITLASETADAKIYYTLDGTTVPSAVNGTEYTAPIKITADTTIKAIAVKDGYTDSEVVTFTYTVSEDAAAVYPPTANIATGMAVESGTEIVLTCVPADAAIYYTLDGTEPIGTTGTLYESPIKITADTTIKAVAVKDGETSEVSTFEYTIKTTPGGDTPGDDTPGAVSKPTADVTPGEVPKGTKVTLTSATADAKIYYTTDETEPTEQSTEYTAPIDLGNEAGKVVIRAIAVKDGNKSSVAVFEYTIVEPGDPGVDKEHIWITGLAEYYYYTGAKITPDIKVWDCDITGSDRLLVPGVDYTVAYKNNVKQGTAEVVVTGKGNYAGKGITENFTIKYAEDVKESDLISVKGGKIELLKDYREEYDGTPKYPGFKLVLKGKSPVTYEYKYDPDAGRYAMTDGDMNINVAVSNNVNKGSATILVTGKKEKGKATSVKASFKITPVDLSKADVTIDVSSAVYGVKGAVPESLTVTCNGMTLVNGKDYTVKYGNNKKAGAQGTVTVTGKGNYTKKAKTEKFAINTLDMSKLSVNAVTACENAVASKVKATVVDTDGNELKASQYTLKIYKEKDGEAVYGKTEKLNAGDTIYVEATALTKDTNLTGSTPRAEFTVGKDISKAKFELSGNAKKGIAYTGSEIKLADSDLKVTLKGSTSKLEMGKDYEIVAYSNNINKGTATAVIRGIGEYSGTKTIKFKITQKTMQNGNKVN